MVAPMNYNCLFFTAILGMSLAFPVGLSAADSDPTENSVSARVHVVILGKDSGKEGFPAEAIYEEGHTVDGMRSGLWKRFYPTGKLRSEIHFAMGDPFGDYRLYTDQGVLYEEGRWEFGMNVGKLRRFWPNGTPQQILTFDSQGVGQGEQRHYHDNGQLEMVVELSNGEEYGDLVRLDREGRVISRTTYQKGRVVQRTH